MLTRQGVTAWQHALTEIAGETRPAIPVTTPLTTPTSSPAAAPALPGPLAAELVNALAAVALAGT